MELTTKDKIADKRLQKLYGITLEEYNQKLAEQGGVCAICKQPPGTIRLSVDHDHRFDRLKISHLKSFDVWITRHAPAPDGILDEIAGTNRGQNKKLLKQYLRRRSIRGLLHFQCNKGLQYYRDIPERLESAAAYLKKFCPQSEQQK